MVRLSALHTSHLYPQERFLVLISVRLSQPQGHSVARNIMSMKNSSDIFRIRTHGHLACATVPQPTVPLHAPRFPVVHAFNILCSFFLRSDQRLSLVGNPGQLLKPSQTSTMSCEYLSLDTMERWIVCKCFSLCCFEVYNFSAACLILFH